MQVPIGGPVLLPDIHATVTTADINTAAPCVEKDIVSISASHNGAGRHSGGYLEDDEAGGIAKNHSSHQACGIERHRKVGAKIRHPPARRLPAGIHIDDNDLACIRHVDKGTAVRGVQLKALGMSLQRNAAYDRCLYRIDHGQAPASIADDEVPGSRIEPDIVRVIGEIDRPSGGQFGAVEQAHRTVAGAGNGQNVGSRCIAEALRFLEAFDAAYDGA